VNNKEKELLRIIRRDGRVKTVDIVEQADMCKVTVLKYLNKLKDAGLVDYELVGPTKLWYAVEDGGPRGRGPLNILDVEISELLDRFEAAVGKRAFVIMTDDRDLINILSRRG